MTDEITLLTGITGFVGGALAARWVDRAGSLVAIVRAASVQHARVRVAESVARFVGPDEAFELAGAIRVILGDLADEATFEDPTFDDVTHVVHAAACTSFGSTREVWRSNVLGTTLLAERVRRAPGLRRFLYVGTAYCCGTMPNRQVHEDDSPRADHRYVNEYSRTKAAVEERLPALLGDVSLVVARPSVVIGHSSRGVGPSSSLFWYYRALAALGAGPFALSARRDIVPVDYVADALAFLSDLEEPRFRTYHVSAGEAGAVTVDEIMSLFGRPFEWRTVAPVELGEMTTAIERLVRTEDEAGKLARGLVACAHFGALGVDFFDNTRLLQEGFRLPPRFTEYLPRCIATVDGRTVYEQMVDDD